MPAQDVTKSSAFMMWFKNSTVVDEHGRPLVVHHGHAEKFEIFTSGIRRSTRGVDSGKPAFYFTPREGTAMLWAINSAAGRGDESVIPAYLSMQNPKYYYNWEDWCLCRRSQSKSRRT